LRRAASQILPQQPFDLGQPYLRLALRLALPLPPLPHLPLSLEQRHEVDLAGLVAGQRRAETRLGLWQEGARCQRLDPARRLDAGEILGEFRRARARQQGIQAGVELAAVVFQLQQFATPVGLLDLRADDVLLRSQSAGVARLPAPPAPAAG